MSVELRQLVQAVGIKRRTAVLIADAGDFLDYEFEVTPEDFLDQAEQDYDTGGKQRY